MPKTTTTATVARGRSEPRRSRVAAWLLGLVCGLVLVGGAGEWAAARETRQQLDALRRTAEMQVLGLSAAVTRFEYLPYAVAQHQDVLAVLAAPRDTAARDRANRFLEGVAQRASLSALYVMDDRGSTLAASNWDTLTTFVGQSYRDRPYFTEARNGRTGTFYGVGLTTGVPGYFIGAPVRRPGADAVDGVVALKLSLDPIAKAWALLREPIVLSDSRGIAFLSNRPAWLYHGIRPQTTMELEWLRYFKASASSSARSGALAARARRGWSGRLVTVDAPGPARRLLSIDEPLPDFGWTLTVTADHRPIVVARQVAWAISALLLLALLLGACTGASANGDTPSSARPGASWSNASRPHPRAEGRARLLAGDGGFAAGGHARARPRRPHRLRQPGVVRDARLHRRGVGGAHAALPLLAPGSLEKHWRDNEAVVTGKAALNGFESRVRHRDGHDVYTMVYTAPLLDASGRQSGWMSSVVDITAQKQAEERQRSQQAQLQKGHALAQPGRDGFDAGARAEPAAHGAVQLCRCGTGLCRARAEGTAGGQPGRHQHTGHARR